MALREIAYFLLEEMKIDKHRQLLRIAVFLCLCAHRLTPVAAFYCKKRPSFPARAINCPPKSPNYSRTACSTYSTTNLLMGLDENEIDWDADLFGQIGKSDEKELGGVDIQNSDCDSESDALNDTIWEMGQSNSKKSDAVKSMREKMKQSWGRADQADQEKGGSPTADWMPGFGKGPDDDEPWFTG